MSGGAAAVSRRAQRAQRGFGVERQRAHREGHPPAPPLIQAEAEHLALLEAVAAGQAEQAAESESTSAAGAAEVSDPSAAASDDPGALVAADHAVTPPESGVRAGRARDPRLGGYRNVGAFLHHCWRRLGLSRSEVYAVAGIASTEKPARLLDFTGGGLHALYEACEATKKARAA